MGYSGTGGKLIHEKYQKQKISWHCPFNAWYKVFNHNEKIENPELEVDAEKYWRKKKRKKDHLFSQAQRKQHDNGKYVDMRVW